MIKIHTFIKKGKEGSEGRPQIGGQWKVPSLVAFGMFHVWLLLEGKGEASFSPPSTFHPIRFYLIVFPLILGFFFTMVLDHYFAYFLHFLLSINYSHTFLSTKSSTHSLPSWFWSKIFFFSWIHGVAHDYILQASSCTNERKIASRNFFRFDINLTSLWWKSQTTRNAPSFRNRTLSNLVLSNFSKHSSLVILL